MVSMAKSLEKIEKNLDRIVETIELMASVISKITSKMREDCR